MPVFLNSKCVVLLAKTKGVIKLRTELKKFRIGVHLTQAEMANKCGVSRVTYGLIEKGKRGGSATFWDNLQKTFNVPDSDMRALQKTDEQGA